MSDLLVQTAVCGWPNFDSYARRQLAMTLLPKDEQLSTANQTQNLVNPRNASQKLEKQLELAGNRGGAADVVTPLDAVRMSASAMKRPIPALREDGQPASNEEGAEKKRQRVENIVTSICQPRSPKPTDLTQTSPEQRNKRKMFVPQQQHGSVNGDVDVVNDDECHSPVNVTADSVKAADVADREKELLKDQLKIMGEQLHKMQQRYQEMFEKRELERLELMSRLALQQPQVELESYLRAIRSEIGQSVKMAITETLEKTLPHYKEKMQSASRDQAMREPSQAAAAAVADSNKHLGPSLPVIPTSVGQQAHHAMTNQLLSLPLYYGQSLAHPPFSSHGLSTPFNNNVMSSSMLQAAIDNELMESQMYGRESSMSKKKRTKVTDTRLSPRGSKPSDNISPKHDLIDQGKAFDAYGPGSALFPSMNPSMAAMQTAAFFNGLCGSGRPDSLKGGARSPTNLSDASERGTSSPDLSISASTAPPGQNVTLTPLHLRKAKLMFFYVRYPSSVLLKNYFCDVHFNKNNTAQLVKWFSNFREFYYIQMEKYARQSIAEGVTAEQVDLTPESELYKILNLHYNRNNQIEVPRSFLETIQITLKEFIKAVSLGKDREQSWKKPIYKVIARLDDTVPEYFKSQDWMEQLSD